MAVRLEAVTFGVGDAFAAARFWSELLERDVHAEPHGAFLPGSDTQVGLRFVASSRPAGGRQRLHLHLTSAGLQHQEHTVATALHLGGRRLDVGQRPDESFVVLADPAGNAFCVIEPDNSLLAGTGHLGEVTCDGSRAVGSFWSTALDWPLVWDQGAQTAVQSSLGGTKISWDEWNARQTLPRDRQRFDLVATDLDADVNRLVALGATRLSCDEVFADPDGNVFELRHG